MRNRKVLEGISVNKLEERIVGYSFKSTKRHGKYLFINLKDFTWMVFHFGMTGNLKYFKYPDKEPSYSRLSFNFVNGYHLVYISQRMLGRIRLVNDIGQFIHNKKLGPDALKIDFRTFKKIMKRGRGSIKSSLVNQKLIAGIGNIYSDEILFHSHIHPMSNVKQMNDEKIKKIFYKIKNILQTAINCRANPKLFPKTYLFHYRKKGSKCPYCGEEVKRIKISGRSSYYCPRCQNKMV